jgi:hypothetical protein
MQSADTLYNDRKHIWQILKFISGLQSDGESAINRISLNVFSDISGKNNIMRRDRLTLILYFGPNKATAPAQQTSSPFFRPHIPLVYWHKQRSSLLLDLHLLWLL